MRITAMGNWRPRPGPSVCFVPTPACLGAAASAPVHPGPVTFLTQNHVRASAAGRAAGRTHRGYLGSGTEVDGDLDTEAMGRALTLFVRRHEALRLWFECVDGQVIPHLVPSAAIAFEAVGSGDLTTTEAVHDHMTARFDAETSSDRFPGFAVGAITRPGGFALYLACDHGLSDGVSQALALDEIAELYAELVSDQQADGALPGSPAAVETSGYLDYAAAEESVAANHLEGSPETRAWQEIFARHDLTMPRFPLDLGLTPGETAQVAGVEISLLDRAGIVAFDAACRSGGGRFVDGIYAAMAIADRELADVEDYYGMAVFNTRGALDGFATAQGWFCAFAPVEFRVAGASSFTELIGRAHTARRRARELAAVPVSAALAAVAAAGATPESILTAPNLLSYIDFRWFPGVGREAFRRGVLFTGEGRTANASAWINRDQDELYLGSQVPGTPFAQAQAWRYYEHVRGIIADIARDGDRAIMASRETSRLQRGA